MKNILFAATALSLLAAAPVSAQTYGNPVSAAGNVAGTAVGTAGNVAGTAVGTAGSIAAAPFGGMNGGGMSGGKSCVSNGAFVPCQQPMMGAGMRDDMGGRRLTRREARAQRRMMQQQDQM